MTAIPYATAEDPRRLPFKDRRASLKVVGVLLIVFGALSACMGALTPLGMWMSTQVMTRPPRVAPSSAPTTAPTTAPGAVVTLPPARAQSAPFQIDYKTMAMAAGFYLVAATLMIWVGVGSLRVRRWVRPVMLVLCWSWLITGGVSFLHMALFGASIREVMSASAPPGSPAPPPALQFVMGVVMGAASFLMMVLVPAVLVWLYQRRGVRETLEHFDRRFVWTDRCPTRVLAVSAWLALLGFGCAVYATYAVLPVYGTFHTGAPAVAAMVAMAAVFLWLAWGTYRLQPVAWWGAIIAAVVWPGSMIWTFTRLGYHEFYRQAGYSPQQIDMMMRFSGQWEDSSVWMMALWSVALVALLLYVRPDFSAGPTGPGGPAPTPPPLGPLPAPAP